MTVTTALTLEGLTGSLAAIGYGDPGNPPMLALHGWLDNAASFAPLADYLDTYYIVALDFSGHGYSAHRPAGEPYHLTDYVADVAHVIDHLGWVEFDLIGHSLGAGVAIAYAAVFPEVVRKLVVIDGIGPITAKADAAADRLRKSIDAGLLEATEERRSRPPRNYDSWDKLIDARCLASPIDRKNAELLVRRGARETDQGLILNADGRLKHSSPMYLSEQVVVHFIERISAPVLVILADEGMIIKRSFTEARLAAFQNATVKNYPGKHHLHMDTPAVFAEDLLQFLEN